MPGMARMLQRAWNRDRTCDCCDYSLGKKAARREERRRWQRDWDGWR